MTNLAQRSALGQSASVGSLYNARTDSFLPTRLFTDRIPPEAINTTVYQRSSHAVGYGNSYEKKFDMMGISPALAASVLARLVACQGASMYLGEKRSNNCLHAALHHTLVTVQERLNLSCAGLKDCLQHATIQTQDVTHIVAGIEWGIRSIIVVEQQLPPGDNIEAKNAFQSKIISFQSDVDTSRPMAHTIGAFPQHDPNLDITAYSDILEDGIMMHDFNEALEFLGLMPLHAKDFNQGKGKPVTYFLLPIDILSFSIPVQIFDTGTHKEPPTDCLRAFVKLFDQLQTDKETLENDGFYISTRQQYFPPQHLQHVRLRAEQMQAEADELVASYRHALQAVRNGADPQQLQKLLEEYRLRISSQNGAGNVGTLARQTVEAIERLVFHGAAYFGHNTKNVNQTLSQELAKYAQGEAFVFFFNVASISHELWKPNYDLVLELLRTRRDPSRLIAIVDCSATATRIEGPRIAQYERGEQITEDFLEISRYMADKCFARCPDQSMETQDVQKPVQRRFVTIACPGTSCSGTEEHEWLCPRCMVPIEYGFSDRYIYCECGRSLYSNYEFKCNDQSHGPEYARHDSETFLALLMSLRQDNYVNILILGETGVGKSTFINAFVNYLEFETLDDAIGASQLNWVIPCSFATQIMDRNNPDQPIQEKEVVVGSRDDERDGSKGDSATQRTTVYPVTVSRGASSLTVRLIDTPGIGDTRGVAYDQQNMSDILSTLSSYEQLHGILILLKPNASRLTITFSYCVKQLLTHLHHTAAQNMVFGFTNTRISNYTPGDTYGPLKTLLGQHPDVGLSLTNHTTYCFDSESFRYLAAYKSGIHLPNKEDFDRSWKHSRDEVHRLITHFESTPPHVVRNTISLNGARELINELTKPMAEISQTIRTNIALCEDQARELKDTRLTGDQLRAKLAVKVIQLTSVPLSQPRTVCANISCKEIRDDGKGQGVKVTVYKTHCHPICYLTDVKVDEIAHPGLIHCAAFGGNRTCNKCAHRWQEHLHVLYELVSETATVDDQAIKTKIEQNANDVTLRQIAYTQLKTRVAEYQRELAMIREAAAKFGIFLKKFSITPYNDATIAYLDFLIKEEQNKVNAGGNDQKLRNLLEEREKHKQTIEILTKTMNTKADWNDLTEGGIQRIVEQLYRLKHFGRMLQNLKQGITSAHHATYRERPYTVKRRKVRVVYRTASRSGPSSAPHAVRRREVQPRPLSGRPDSGRPIPVRLPAEPNPSRPTGWGKIKSSFFG